MAENSSALFSVGQASLKSRSRLGGLDAADLVALLQVVAGFALIMATVWTVGPLQRFLFWVSAAWYSFWAVVSLWQRRRDALRMP